MSLETWKAEFYPTEAKDCPAEQAIAHSLRKWEGLTVENVDKHAVVFDGWWKVLGEPEEKPLTIDSESCALCVNYITDEKRPYIDAEGDEDATTCGDCPLMAQNGGFQCDHANHRGVTIYNDGLKNPLIMITALKETLKANE